MGKQIYCKHRGCYELVDSGRGYCDAHINERGKQSREVNTTYNQQRPERHRFYHTKEWKQLRKKKVAKTPYCERCKAKGVYRPVEIVHHKIEIEQDWSKRLEIDNLESVCRSCHNEIHSNSDKKKKSDELKKVIEKYR